VFDLNKRKVFHQRTRQKIASVTLKGVFFRAHHDRWLCLRLPNQLFERLPKHSSLPQLRIRLALATQLFASPNIVNPCGGQGIAERIPVEVGRKS